MSFTSLHIVKPSPWPFITSLRVLWLAFRVLGALSSVCFIEGAMRLVLVACLGWWSDVSREGSLLGRIGALTYKALWTGIALFIISEVLLFISFFWAFFHFRLVPDITLGGVWPPAGIMAFNPFGVPLLNTTLLLSRGISITWAHMAFLSGKKQQGQVGLTLTLILGLMFSLVQLAEYLAAGFDFSRSVYGRIFLSLTGLHGSHVLIGASFLASILLRNSLNLMSRASHTGFEISAWYWHFVDVVWIFLFSLLYWWGGPYRHL